MGAIFKSHDSISEDERRFSLNVDLVGLNLAPRATTNKKEVNGPCYWHDRADIGLFADIRCVIGTRTGTGTGNRCKKPMKNPPVSFRWIFGCKCAEIFVKSKDGNRTRRILNSGCHIFNIYIESLPVDFEVNLVVDHTNSIKMPTLAVDLNKD